MRKLHIKQFIAMASALLYAGLAVHHENVFWISGQSSLLGSLFLALALYLTFTERLSKPPVKYVWAATVGILVFLSMLSYDSLLIAPIILFLEYVFIHKIRFLQALPILLLLPAYWGLRTASDALLPSGDYGYKPSTFVVNSIANTLTYIVATFAGPKAIESASVLRLLVKPYLVPLTVAMGIVGSVAAVFFWTIRRKILQHTVQIALLLSFVVSLFPFIGLGGSAERYAIVPTFFIILSLARLVSEIKLSKARILVWGSLTLLYLAVFIWNITEVSRISTEWKFAGHVSEETLLKLKREYFPLTVRKTFIFVDTPIRYGRAWIFPTGLTDALWHMFRQAPFTVLRMSNIEDALLYPQTTSSVVVHRFENYIVKKVEVLVTETE